MELFYKGYRTNVEFDDEEQYYYGKLEGIDDFVNFGTEFEDKIVEEFHSAVEDYLEYCAAIDKEPNREVSNKLDVPLNSKLYNSLTAAAKNAGESFNAFVEKILAEYMAKTA